MIDDKEFEVFEIFTVTICIKFNKRLLLPLCALK